MSNSYGEATQVLSCAPAHVRNSFPINEGESSQRLDTEKYAETNEKTHEGRVPSGRPFDFGSTPGKSPGFRDRETETGNSKIRT